MPSRTAYSHRAVRLGLVRRYHSRVMMAIRSASVTLRNRNLKASRHLRRSLSLMRGTIKPHGSVSSDA